MTDRLFTRPFVFVWLANFGSGMAYSLFLHFSGYLSDLGASDTQIGVIYACATMVQVVTFRPINPIVEVDHQPSMNHVLNRVIPGRRTYQKPPAAAAEVAGVPVGCTSQAHTQRQ